jgi:hypothetical protein
MPSACHDFGGEDRMAMPAKPIDNPSMTWTIAMFHQFGPQAARAARTLGKSPNSK